LADIQHSAIPDGQRHEPKGISSAANKTLYIANGSASGAWTKLGPQSLSGVTTNGTLGQFVAVDGAGNFVLASAPSGSIYFYNISTPYTLTYPSTFTKAAPTTTANGSPVLMTEGTNARLTYTGTSNALLDVVFNLSLDQASGSARDIEVAIYKNGSLVNGSNAIVTTASGEKHNLACHADVSVVTNDYLEVYVKNGGASGDVRIYTFSLFATTAGA
jgi:hypothetical protein